MVVLLKHRLGIFETVYIVLASVLILTGWFFLIYPALEPTIIQFAFIAYTIFAILYTTFIWYLARNLLPFSKIEHKR